MSTAIPNYTTIKPHTSKRAEIRKPIIINNNNTITNKDRTIKTIKSSTLIRTLRLEADRDLSATTTVHATTTISSNLDRHASRTDLVVVAAVVDKTAWVDHETAAAIRTVTAVAPTEVPAVRAVQETDPVVMDIGRVVAAAAAHLDRAAAAAAVSVLTHLAIKTIVNKLLKTNTLSLSFFPHV